MNITFLYLFHDDLKMAIWHFFLDPNKKRSSRRRLWWRQPGLTLLKRLQQMVRSSKNYLRVCFLYVVDSLLQFKV